MTIKGVTIGDKFISPGKAKRVETVTYFIERRNMITGEVVGYECWASHEFMGQTMNREIPFNHAIRYRVTQ